MTGESKPIEDEQRQVAELLRSFDTPAPERLHRQVEALVAAHSGSAQRARARRGRRRPRATNHRSRNSPWGPISASAVAAVAVVAVVAGLTGIFNSGAGSSTPSLRQAAAPTLRAATLPAPPESGANRSELTAAVDGVKFPYWGERFGWRATGMRGDRIDGHIVTTVFYSNASGRRIGYAILAGTPAPRIDGGVVIWRGGVPYRLLSEHGAAVVTWLRDGRLCVVSGRGVSSATLLRLASWSDREASAS
jgi:hypothetical protein